VEDHGPPLTAVPARCRVQAAKRRRDRLLHLGEPPRLRAGCQRGDSELV